MEFVCYIDAILIQLSTDSIPLVLINTHSHTHSYTLPPTHTHIHSLTHSLTHARTHTFIHSPTQSHIHSFTHSLTHPPTLACRRTQGGERSAVPPTRPSDGTMRNCQSRGTYVHTCCLLFISYYHFFSSRKNK